MFDPFGDSTEANALNEAKEHEEIRTREPFNRKGSNEIKYKSNRECIILGYFLRNEYLISFFVVVSCPEVNDNIYNEDQIHY